VLRNGKRKLVVTSTGETFLFDLEKDPLEEQDIAASEVERTKALRKELDTWVAALGLMPLDAPPATDGVAAKPIDPAAQEQLRKLGYVD
jgi:hypothetical protein